jgi:IclR family KDG regulon transcriptional repressor
MEDDAFDAKQPESVAAVLKVFAILQAIADSGDAGISELSIKLAMPKATVYRFLQTMKTLGYVRQEADSERYALTMRVFELGTKGLPNPDLVEVAKEHMRLLADRTGETVHLGMLIDSEIIYVHKVDSRHMLGMYSRVGRRAPIHCTAIGKVLLAWESDAFRDSVLAGAEFKRFRDKTITDRGDFIKELDRTRDQGFGEDREEFDEHIRCVGVPVFDRLQQAVAGLSISFPTFRFDESKQAEVLKALTDASRAISTELGCTRFPLDAAATATAARSTRRSR